MSRYGDRRPTNNVPASRLTDEKELKLRLIVIRSLADNLDDALARQAEEKSQTVKLALRCIVENSASCHAGRPCDLRDAPRFHGLQAPSASL